VNPNDPLIQGMIQYGAQIMAQVEILANQGPNSINGGGTPIVPLNPNPNDLPGTTTTVPSQPSTTPGTTTGTQQLTTTSGGSLKDAAGNVWTLTSAGSVTENGLAVAGGSGTKTFAIVNGVYYGQDATTGNWYTYSATNNTWTSAAAPTLSSPSTTTTTTPTTITTTTTTTPQLTPTSGGSLKDAAGNVWTLTSGGSVAENGAAVPNGGGTKTFAIVNNTDYGQDAASGNWYTYSTTSKAWSAATAPKLSTTTLSLSASGNSATVTPSQVSVVATSGTRMLFVKGSGDTISVSGGTNTITDTGSGNTYVLPASGKGSDVFTSNILNTTDVLDLRSALAATSWTGTSSTLSNYLKVASTAQGTTLSIAPTGSGASSVIATIQGATNTSLSTLLTHSLT
jgi:hypothetical protein